VRAKIFEFRTSHTVQLADKSEQGFTRRFRILAKKSITFTMSVRMYQLDSHQNLILDAFIKICRQNPNLGQNIGKLQNYLRTVRLADDIKSPYKRRL
jgi:hypothetical protein